MENEDFGATVCILGAVSCLQEKETKKVEGGW